MSRTCVCLENQLIYDYLIHKSQGLKQSDNNMHIKINILKACKSVLKYPLPIRSEEDALKLQGVGHTIAKEMMKILQHGNGGKTSININFTEYSKTLVEERNVDHLEYNDVPTIRLSCTNIDNIAKITHIVNKVKMMILTTDQNIVYPSASSKEIIDLCSPTPIASRRRKIQESSSDSTEQCVTTVTDRLLVEGILPMSPTTAPATIRQCRNITPIAPLMIRKEIDETSYNGSTIINDYDEEQQVVYVEENVFETFDEYVPLHMRLKNKYDNSNKDKDNLTYKNVNNTLEYKHLIQSLYSIESSHSIDNITKQPIISNTQCKFIDLTEDNDDLPHSELLKNHYDKYTNINTSSSCIPIYNNINNNNETYSQVILESDSKKVSSSSSQTTSASLFHQVQETPSLASYSNKPQLCHHNISVISDNKQGFTVDHSENISTTIVKAPPVVSIYQLLKQKERELKILNKSYVENNNSTVVLTENQINRSQANVHHKNTLNKPKKAAKNTNTSEIIQSNFEQINEPPSTTSLILETTSVATTTTTVVNRSYYTEKILVPLPSIITQWEVVLLIDKRERDNALIQSKLVAKGVSCEICTLAVGDFLWIARPYGCSTTVVPEEMDSRTSIPDQSNADIFVLDCIAERKTIADLASSIIDGRYMEQKARLKACSLRSTMYIIEGEHIILPRQHKAITATHIKTAIISINVDNPMHVVRTRSIDHTISCLQGIHRQVKARFERHHHPRNVSTNYNYCSSNNNNSSESIKLYQPFSQFQLLYEKKGAATNKQLFGHQLRQIQGVSVSVALTLMDKYGTTANFVQALLSMGGDIKAEYVLSNLTRHGSTKRFGPALAKRLCQVYLETY